MYGNAAIVQIYIFLVVGGKYNGIAFRDAAILFCNWNRNANNRTVMSFPVLASEATGKWPNGTTGYQVQGHKWVENCVLVCMQYISKVCFISDLITYQIFIYLFFFWWVQWAFSLGLMSAILEFFFFFNHLWSVRTLHLPKLWYFSSNDGC